MITLKNTEAIKKMSVAGTLLAELFQDIAAHVKPGTSTLHLDGWIAQQLKARGLVSQAKGYHGYKHDSCISLNDEVVHGVPSQEKILQEGDLVKIDICAAWQGYCADMARCFFVGSGNDKMRHLVSIAQQALEDGIAQARSGNRLSDISAAIQKTVEKNGYGVVRDFAGHGIGTKMHEDPEILNYGKAGQGPVLQAGMTFAIEPMITMGSYKVYVEKDGWTVKTCDKSIAAHVEDTIVITQEGPQILTRLSGEGEI